MQKKNHYIDQLTWLRGFAAFLVIVSHTIRTTEIQYYSDDPLIKHGLFSALDLGTFGVLLFFALSGCTLYISNANKIAPTTVRRFYIKRFLRIWPAFAVSAAMYLMFRLVFKEYYPFELEARWIERLFLNDLSISDVLEQLALVSNFTGADLVNNAYWSLPVEFQYYLVFPMLIVSTRLIGFSGPLIIGILLYFLPKVISVSSSQVFVLALSFCGGVSVGYLYDKYNMNVKTIIGCSLFLSSFALVSAHQLNCFTLPDVKFISNTWNFYSVVAVLLVFFVLHSDFSLPAKVAGFLKHYGEISYSTYLYHNLVIGVLMLFLLNLGIEGAARFYVLLIFTLVFTQFIAHYSHRLIELPTMRLGRKV